MKITSPAIHHDVGIRHPLSAGVQTEGRLPFTNHMSSIVIWVAGADKLRTFLNQAWPAFAGSDIDLFASGWSGRIHPDDVKHCLSIYLASFDARESFEMEYRARGFDGTYRWIFDKGAPYFASDDSFAGYVGCMIDTTEWKPDHETPRLEATAAARPVEREGARSGFAAQHFSNLLGCILADADSTMSELEPASPAYRALERIETEAIHASTLLRGIMSGPSGATSVTASDSGATTLQVLLPDTAAGPALQSADNPFSEGDAPSQGHVLIVEDEVTLRLAVSTMLRRRGFSVLETGAGELALELIRSKEYIAVVLLDLTLPGRPGREVFEELRQIRPELKVILTSAHSRASVISPLRGLRPDGFIRKPYRFEELVTLLHGALPSKLATAPVHC